MPESSLFETMLASTVHDMKNSLSLLLSQLDSISEQLVQDDSNRQSVSDLRYQASRINISLMELLTLYKLEKNQVGIHIAEVFIADFLEDSIAAHSLLAQNKGIQLDMDCDDELMWFFDPDMVGIAMNNIIGNCMRYTHSRVLVSAAVEERKLVIRVDDDGEGYPKHMLGSSVLTDQSVDSNTGSTGLGLYFAATIAKMHRRQDNEGAIQLENGASLNGGRFQISLP